MIELDMALKHEFVEFIPANIAEGKLYISIPYATATHKCCCGCGNVVITPFSPTDWKLTFDGRSVSLAPSIGNWSFDCNSHYWIKSNQVVWATKWTEERIESGRACDRYNKGNHYSQIHYEMESTVPKLQNTQSKPESFWSKLQKILLLK